MLSICISLLFYTGAAYSHLEFLSQSGGNHQGGFGIDHELGLSSTQDFVIPRTDPPPASQMPYLAPQVSDVDGSVQGLFIRTGLMQQGVLDSASDTFGNILARVPIKVEPGERIFHDPACKSKIFRVHCQDRHSGIRESGQNFEPRILF